MTSMTSSRSTSVRTVAQLAEVAGLSTSTISRALAGHRSISLATRTRIIELAEEHGFRPNLIARSLRTRRKNAVAVVLPLGHEAGQHLSDPFSITMLGALGEELTERGYHLLLSRVIPEGALTRPPASGHPPGSYWAKPKKQCEEKL